MASGRCVAWVSGAAGAESVSRPATALLAGQESLLPVSLKTAAGHVVWVGSAERTAMCSGGVTVSATGLVTGAAAGAATITATSEGQTGSAAVTVNDVPVAPVASVSLSPAATGFLVGQAVQLTATLKDAAGNVLSGRSVVWISSAWGVATVSASGLVTGAAAGAATITATSEGQTGSAAVTVNDVPVAPVESVSVSPAATGLLVGQSVQLTATLKDAAGNVLSGRSVIWISSAWGVATVSATGLVTGAAAGAATITATSEGQSGSAAVTVNGVPVASVASVSVSPAATGFLVGQ